MAGQEERDVVMTKFSQKMYVSGYKEEKRKEILLAGSHLTWMREKSRTFIAPRRKGFVEE